MISSLSPTAPPFYPSYTNYIDTYNAPIYSTHESAYDTYTYAAQYHHEQQPIYVYPHVLGIYCGAEFVPNAVEYFYSHCTPSPLELPPPAYGARENGRVGGLGFQGHGWDGHTSEWQHGYDGMKKGNNGKKKNKARKMWRRKEREERSWTHVMRGEEGYGFKEAP